MFEFTKFAGWLLAPLPLFLLGSIAALCLAWRGQTRLGLGLFVVLWSGLCLTATPWFAFTLAHSLERQYPAVAVAQTIRADAALVLGGTLAPAQPPERPHANLGGAIDRLWHAAALYQADKVRAIVLAGGNQPGFEGVQSEAQAMRALLLAWGVPDSAIWLEERSRNTQENARYSREVVLQIKARRVLLVTSALHMPRAMAIFKAAFQGSAVELVPASTDVESVTSEHRAITFWLPDANALVLSGRAIKELLGRVYFQWTGAGA